MTIPLHHVEIMKKYSKSLKHNNVGIVYIVINPTILAQSKTLISIMT